MTPPLYNAWVKKITISQMPICYILVGRYVESKLVKDTSFQCAASSVTQPCIFNFALIIKQIHRNRQKLSQYFTCCEYVAALCCCACGMRIKMQTSHKTWIMPVMRDTFLSKTDVALKRKDFQRLIIVWVQQLQVICLYINLACVLWWAVRWCLRGSVQCAQYA